MPNFIRKKEAAVKSWVVDRRFDYIEEMNRGFEVSERTSGNGYSHPHPLLS